MIEKIVLTNYTEKYDTNNFFNYSCNEMDARIVFGRIVDTEFDGNDTILIVEPDKYGRIGYFLTDVHYSNGELTGIRGSFHLKIDKEKMAKFFKDALFYCYQNGAIVNTKVNDPQNSVYKKRLVKINKELCIYKPKHYITLKNVVVVGSEELVVKKENMLEIIQFIKPRREEVFNYATSADGYRDIEQTYWPLTEIYVPLDTLEKIKSMQKQLNGYEFAKIDRNIILAVPMNVNGVYYFVTTNGIFPVAIVEIFWSDFDQYWTIRHNDDLKEWVRELRKNKMETTAKQRSLIKKIINEAIDKKASNCYDFRIMLL